mmetsp:Transcript_31232/g.27596  ORF Transcript_31232/g.27596 Transcript_31232/m.27596 type:complete len:138 (-) Transcript_31232:134-547(-)
MNFLKANLKYKVEEFKVIEEIVRINEEAKHNKKLNKTEYKSPHIDFSTEENYFRDLQNTIQLTMQNIKSSTYQNKSNPSYKNADKSLTNSIVSLKALKEDLKNQLDSSSGNDKSLKTKYEKVKKEQMKVLLDIYKQR